jgi:hypothetical protein
MAYINRGPDPRILGPLGGWIQSKLSFHSSTPPRVLRLGSKGHVAVTWPPFLSIAIPLPSEKGDCWPIDAATPRYATFRSGWRWDPNWGRGGYIADVIVKLNMERPVVP